MTPPTALSPAPPAPAGSVDALPPSSPGRISLNTRPLPGGRTTYSPVRGGPAQSAPAASALAARRRRCRDPELTPGGRPHSRRSFAPSLPQRSARLLPPRGRRRLTLPWLGERRQTLGPAGAPGPQLQIRRPRRAACQSQPGSHYPRR